MEAGLGDVLWFRQGWAAASNSAQSRENPAKVTWKSIDPPLRETMLQRGEVDAITGFTFTSYIGLVKQRDPLIAEAVELKRLKMAIEFVDTPVARSEGLGAINKLRFDNTIDRVVAAFGIKSQVSPDGIFNSSFLPPARDRKL